MTSFRFNFNCEENQTAIKKENEEKENHWIECTQIIPNIKANEFDNLVEHAKMFTCGDVEIGHVIVNEALSKFHKNDTVNGVMLAEDNHSDLVPAKYEGGLKIWECTLDMVAYLEDNKETLITKGKRILDLGCGAGILGIYTLMNGAEVTFQDYNAEVLETITIPNVLLNIEEDKSIEMKQCKFYSGDWASFDEKCTEKYDIILTSETIYNQSNYEKLISIFMNKLAENGIILVAAKTYYFGVGGGTRQFEAILNNKPLQYEVCWKSSGGIQREIIKITNKV